MVGGEGAQSSVCAISRNCCCEFYQRIGGTRRRQLEESCESSQTPGCPQAQRNLALPLPSGRAPASRDGAACPGVARHGAPDHGLVLNFCVGYRYC